MNTSLTAFEENRSRPENPRGSPASSAVRSGPARDDVLEIMLNSETLNSARIPAEITPITGTRRTQVRAEIILPFRPEHGEIALAQDLGPALFNDNWR
jgi:hypothetical protein